MVRIIVGNKENNACYTIRVFENLYNIAELNDIVKIKLLNEEKNLKKIWCKGEQLLANVYIDNKKVGHLSFKL